MILSDQDILQAWRGGFLHIEPFNENQLNPASYLFTLGSLLLVPKPIEKIDIKNEVFPEYDRHELTEYGFDIKPGDLVLAQTKEKLSLMNSYAMVIEGRSTLARVGLEVVQTSTFIEPDHTNSVITLELKNSGNSTITLYEGMQIAKGIFHELLSPSSPVIGRDSSFSTSDNPQDETQPPVPFTFD